MTCTNCRQPIRACPAHGGWFHTATGLHACGTDPYGAQRAQPQEET